MATDTFIKIGSLSGESQDQKYADWVDVLAWSWGASQHGTFGTGSGGGAGKVNANDFSFTKHLDISTPKTLEALCNGKHFDKIELKSRKAGEKPFLFLEYTFSDCILTSYSTGGSGGESGFTENISFNFAKVKMKYNQQDNKTGQLKKGDETGWDFQKNVKA